MTQQYPASPTPQPEGPQGPHAAPSYEAPQYQPQPDAQYQYQPQQPGVPAQPGYGAPAPYVAAPVQQQPGSGLAVTAFVLGLLAFLGCLIPIVNFVAILLGVVGLVLGFLAVSKARKGLASGKGLGIAGIVLSFLAIIGGIGSSVVYALAFNEVGTAIEDAAEQAAQDAEDSAAGRGVAAEPDEVEEATAEALPLGTPATVGDYDVTVTGITLDANELVASANEFNEPPTNQYVVVDLDVTYNGAEEGNPWIDLVAVVQGSDARQYDDASCMAMLPKDAIDVPTLTQGGQADFQFCMDVPAEALQGATLFVEESLSFDDTRVYWAIQ